MVQTFRDIVNHINNKLGDETIPELLSKHDIEFPHISTGSVIVDYITGIGGIPRGRVTEFHGMQGCGKSTLALMLAAQCQKLGLGVVYLDYENAMELKYATSLGVDISRDKFALVQPSSLEDGLRIAEIFLIKLLCGLVIVDSVAAMAASVEVDASAEIGQTQIGLQARVMAVALRQLKRKINESNVAWLFINQLRDVIDMSWAGQMKARSGKQYITPGGHALRFFCDMRVEFMPAGLIKQEEVNVLSIKEEKRKAVVGQKVRVTTVKNKCAIPQRTGEIILRHGKGIDNLYSCIELAIKEELIKKHGGFFKFGPPLCEEDKMEQTARGIENLVDYFSSNPEKYDILSKQVWTKLSESER